MDKEKEIQNEEGDNMLTSKKEMTNAEKVKYTPAKTKDVLTLINKANQQHGKMLSMLAK